MRNPSISFIILLLLLIHSFIPSATRKRQEEVREREGGNWQRKKKGKG
jgi:hypothetical protein